MNEIKEMPVERDAYGCWIHPEYEKFVIAGSIFRRKNLMPG